MQAQVLYNTGEMYVGAATKTDEATLYIQGAIKVGGEKSNIKHEGKTVLTGDFINDVTVGHVFSSRNGIFEFRGNDSQQIRGAADKSKNYIEFPNQVIINMTTTDFTKSTVVIDGNMGISINNLAFTNGRMVVDSKAVTNTKKTQVAHLLVEGTIDYSKHKAAATSDNGFVQVNLDLEDNYTGGLLGFTSPYKELYADYFFFNFLSIPGTSRLFNGDRNDLWVRNPLTKLTAGVGYVLGQELVSPTTYPSYYKDNLDPQWGGPTGALYSDVIKKKYIFGYQLAPKSFTQFNKNADRYKGEILNLSDVTVPITKGFNYLGNPFTVPLNLSSYIENPTQAKDFGNFVTDEMESAVYLLPEGSAGTYGSVNGIMTFTFSGSFQNISKVGGTYDGSLLIAPMQMFVVQKKTDTPNSFTMPLKQRTHGAAPFLRSASPEVVDELLIETRDVITGGYDRLCVVFRNDATMKGNHRYDADKLFNKTGGVNQIYTRSTNNKELITNVVKPDTKQLAMYLMPSNQRQEVTLTAKRLNSLRSITSVILEDRKTGRLIDLMKTSYTFLSSPSDKTDRFTLHFNSGLVGTDDVKATAPLSAYYSFGQVTVQGLTEKALNKEVMIYTIQGQLLHRQVVTAIEPLLIRRTLDKGVYIINVAEEPQAIKFWVK
jgi:hypothetical protein